MDNQTLISTGITLGLIHVLAGPDHLSALAALAFGTSYRAFMLGIRWGIGHSTGLIVVAVVFILLKGDLDLRLLGRYCDSFVGLFMIFLGCYGVLGALKTFKEKRKKKDSDSTMKHLHSVVSSGTNGNITSLPNGVDGSYVVMRTELDEPQSDDTYGFFEDEHRSEFVSPCPSCLVVDMHDPFTQRVLSFSIGLLHGVAGPGGILGVLPAVEMRNWRSSVLYLGSFILTSTLSMGTFAALYGEVTKRLGATAESVELALSVFSASMSIIVGTIWLVLSLLGKLQRLFH